MKKTLISTLTLIMTLSLCSCGNVEESAVSDNKGTTTTTSVTTTHSTTTTTTEVPDITTTTSNITIPDKYTTLPFIDPNIDDDIHVSIDYSLDLNTYEELGEFINLYYSDYVYYYPTVDESKFTFRFCKVIDYHAGIYCFGFDSIDKDYTINIYCNMKPEPTTYEEYKKSYLETMEMFISDESVYDNENGIIYTNDPWNPGTPYMINYITENGCEINFFADNDFSTEEIKEKFDEFMAAVIN